LVVDIVSFCGHLAHTLLALGRGWDADMTVMQVLDASRLLRLVHFRAGTAHFRFGYLWSAWRVCSWVVWLIHLQACAWCRTSSLHQDNVEERMSAYSSALVLSMKRAQGSTIDMPRTGLEHVLFGIAWALYWFWLVWLFSELISWQLDQDRGNLWKGRKGRRFHVVDGYLKFHKVSRRLKVRIMDALREAKRISRLHEQVDKTQLLELVPTYIQKELAYEEHLSFLQSHVYFGFLDLHHNSGFQDICYSLGQEVFFKHRVLFSVGEASECMIVISSGSAELFSECKIVPRRQSLSGRVSGILGASVSFVSFTRSASDGLEEQAEHTELVQKGQYMSEASLWTRWEHSSSVRCKESGILLSLSCSMLAAASQGHASMYRHCVLYGAFFVDSMDRNGCTEMGLSTDVGAPVITNTMAVPMAVPKKMSV